MKNSLISVILGMVISAVFFLSQKEKVVYVEKPVEKIVEKIVEVKVEVEKIIWKKRSCKMTDDQKQKMCMDLMAESVESIDFDENKISTNDVSNQISENPASTYKNRFTLHMGYGSNGFKTSFDGQRLNIDKKKEFIYGAQYQRKLSDRWSGSAIINSNESGLLGAGFDY